MYRRCPHDGLVFTRKAILQSFECLERGTVAIGHVLAIRTKTPSDPSPGRRNHLLPVISRRASDGRICDGSCAHFGKACFELRLIQLRVRLVLQAIIVNALMESGVAALLFRQGHQLGGSHNHFIVGVAPPELSELVIETTEKGNQHLNLNFRNRVA